MRTTYFHFIDGEVGIGTTYHALAQQGNINEFGIGISSYIGIGTNIPKFPLQITGNHPIESGTTTTDAGVIFQSTVSTATTGKLGGLFTEVDNEILSYGTNIIQLESESGINTHRVGGIFRIDTRTGGGFGDSDCFVVKGRSIGTTVEHNSVIINLHDGNTFLSPDKGKVGIGTTNPTQILHLSSDSNQASIRLSNVGTGGTDWYVQSSGNDASNGQGNFSIYNGAINDYALSITAEGNVGIGTTNPTSKLEVRDSASQGIIVRSTNTQATNTNKAIRVRNNSDTDTFSVSHRGHCQTNSIKFTPMTTTERNALNLGSSDTGTVIYNSSINKLQLWIGASWISLDGGV